MRDIIKSNNRKLINSSNHHAQPWKCRKKEYFPLEEKCETENIIYKFIVSTTGVPDKPYLRTAKDAIKKYFITVSLLS